MGLLALTRDRNEEITHSLFHSSFFTNTKGWQCWHYCQLCVPINLQFSSLFASTADNKFEIRNLGAYQDEILRLNTTLD